MRREDEEEMKMEKVWWKMIFKRESAEALKTSRGGEQQFISETKRREQ